ncbi:hypothetical protein [Streptomyces sp. NPDC002994]|uniref:hypothetical protein n=1 Tax=Streptomyces sp. NPDC002994 TaxID=3154441 RepID=UPI0033A275BA
MSTGPKPVYASQGGSRYHSTRLCNAFLVGQHLWRFDPMQWVPGMPQIMLTNGHRLDEVVVTEALGRGKEPCADCFPGQRAELHRSSSEYDFGHQPVEIQGDWFCGRCRTRYIDEHGDHESYPTLWPCTSAVVLGLVDRPAVAA